MSDLVGNPEDRFSHTAALIRLYCSKMVSPDITDIMMPLMDYSEFSLETKQLWWTPLDDTSNYCLHGMLAHSDAAFSPTASDMTS